MSDSQTKISGTNRRTFVSGLGVALGAGAWMPALAQAAEVKVGFLLPLTGSFAESGQLIKMAVEMAIEEINASGGIKSMKGAKMVGVFGNSTSVDEANTETNRMISRDKVAAIVGAAGLVPGLRALRHGRMLALANKESLVTAGPLLMQTARDHGATILPVDSEHSAVFQALTGEDASAVMAQVGALGDELKASELRLGELLEKFNAMGARPGGLPSAEFSSFLKSEIQMWSEVSKSAGVKPE